MMNLKLPLSSRGDAPRLKNSIPGGAAVSQDQYPLGVRSSVGRGGGDMVEVVERRVAPGV